MWITFDQKVAKVRSLCSWRLEPTFAFSQAQTQIPPRSDAEQLYSTLLWFPFIASHQGTVCFSFSASHARFDHFWRSTPNETPQPPVVCARMEQPVFDGRPGKLPHWASNLEDNVPQLKVFVKCCEGAGYGDMVFMSWIGLRSHFWILSCFAPEPEIDIAFVTVLSGKCLLTCQVDKKLLIILRDGRKLMGWLRTYEGLYFFG